MSNENNENNENNEKTEINGGDATGGFQAGDKIQFVSYYMKLGDIQATTGKDGFVFKEAEVTKAKHGYLFYIVDGETGERKCNLKFVDKFRDFGTSVYGVFKPGVMERKDYIEAIIEKLEERVLETYKAKAGLISELDKIR